MSISVTNSHVQSASYDRSGILHISRRPNCYMVELPNVTPSPYLSSRGHAGPQTSFPKG
jgi:hypothetical protein